MRHSLFALLILSAACACPHPGVTVSVPAPEAGRVRAAAVAAAPVGKVQPVAVGVTNGGAATLRLDVRQVYAHTARDERVAPLAPGEAARLAGGQRMPGAVRGGAVGAVTGGLLGATGGLISGAIQGGVGLAVAAGSAVGAFFGAITGALHGGGSAPDVGGFEDRALHDATLASSFSATGYVYYPRGAYRTLEVLLIDERGRVEKVDTPIDTPR